MAQTCGAISQPADEEEFQRLYTFADVSTNSAGGADGFKFEVCNRVQCVAELPFASLLPSPHLSPRIARAAPTASGS
jgi:hypothetical protein